MFGTYRTLLALMVVARHLGGVPATGGYAVFGFYILSGYLMTLIMQNNYGYTLTGVSKYAANRFLRIYPIYWVSIIFSLMLILYVGEPFASSYHNSMYLPQKIIEILKNILLFFPFMESPRLTPPSWALTVELFYYILIGFGISKYKKVVLVWMTLSIIYHAVVNFMELGSIYTYYIIPAASLPFATGALIFHYRKFILKYVELTNLVAKEQLPVILFFSIIVNWYIGYKVGMSMGFFFYTNFLLCAIMVVLLSERKSLPFLSKKFDKWMGDFSYPIYLIHYQVGLIVVILLEILGYKFNGPNYVLFILSLPFIFIFSWIITTSMEHPIEKIREKIKHKTIVTCQNNKITCK